MYIIPHVNNLLAIEVVGEQNWHVLRIRREDRE